MPTVPNLPAGANTVNPFVITDDAAGLIEFLIEVFGAVDVPEARTLDGDGSILHSELLIGDSMLTVADRKPDWPYTPAFVRVYVDDVDAVLGRAERLGARVVTRPTEFFGDVFARFADPHGNLWWVYRHNPIAGDEPAAGDDWGPDDGSWEAFSTPELRYIHTTLVDAMRALRDPRRTG